jgi:hypothetical protein
MYNFAKCYVQDDGFEGSFEDMVSLFLEGKYWYGPWWDHVDEFANLDNIHFVHYESLLKVSYANN